MKRLLSVLLVVIFITGCSQSNPTTNEQVAFDNETAKNLILSNEFMQRFYSGLYYYTSPDDEVIYKNDKPYSIFIIRYSEIPSEYLNAVNIDFGELSQDKYDKNYYYADISFQTLEELHSLTEKTHTNDYSQKNFYDIYDDCYYENNGQMLYSYDISAVFAYTLDYNTVNIVSTSEHNVTAEITGKYTVTGDMFKYKYDFVFSNGSWKIDTIRNNMSNSLN